MKIAIVGGIPESLVRFRGPLIEAMLAQGHEVIALAGYDYPEFTQVLTDMGARFITYPVGRTSANPLDDLKTYRYLKQLFQRESPDLVLTYTIKPVFWAGLAARHAGVPKVHAMITGLGQQFDPNTSWLMRRVISSLYAFVLPKMDSVIFQNEDDRAQILGKGWVKKERTYRVHGSGVDMHAYPISPMPEGPLSCLMISRLLAAKGVREYAQAAAIVKKRYPDTRFQLVGRAELGRAAISEEEVMRWHNAGHIDYLGELEHITETMQACHLYVLPSYYGEGVPRTVLEAMSMGRAVLTTDNTGCRDPVEHTQSGLIVEPRNVDALVDALTWFVEHPEQWALMGTRGRHIIETRYDVKRVNNDILNILGI